MELFICLVYFLSAIFFHLTYLQCSCGTLMWWSRVFGSENGSLVQELRVPGGTSLLLPKWNSDCEINPSGLRLRLCIGGANQSVTAAHVTSIATRKKMKSQGQYGVDSDRRLGVGGRCRVRRGWVKMEVGNTF